MLVFNFVPRGFDSRRHMGPRLAADLDCISSSNTSSTNIIVGVGNPQECHQWAILRWTSTRGAIDWVKVPWRRKSRSSPPRVEVPCGAANWNPLGTKLKPKIFEFMDPSDQNQLQKKNWWTIPLRWGPQVELAPVLKCVYKLSAVRMQSHTGCTCLTFPHCGRKEGCPFPLFFIFFWFQIYREDGMHW